MKLEYIAPNWPAPKNIRCMTTTRVGGYSQQEYHSLNLGDHVKDHQQNVENNRQLIKEGFLLPSEPAWLEQVHGSSVLSLGDKTPADNKADAAYTNEAGVVCAVLTADCLPVAFCDQTGEHVAVAHAGWRGLVNGVLENTLQTMPLANEKIICWLGPAIGSTKFEVGREVREKFIAIYSKHENAFQAQEKSKYLANIYQLAKNVLSSNGVKNIYGGEYCTYTQKDSFFSYRRDGQTGRMATFIWKKY
jgi:YfiH family protein